MRLTAQERLRTTLRLSELEIWIQRESGQLSFLEVQSELMEEIRSAQPSCSQMQALREQISRGRPTELSEGNDGMLMFQQRVVVPSVQDLRQRILREAHTTPYSVHPGTNKMYQDLRQFFWWPRMRVDVADFVARCQVCQQVRIEHGRPAGLVKPLPVPEWK